MKAKKQTRARSWPAPDPASRVVVDANGNSPLPPRVRRRRWSRGPRVEPVATAVPEPRRIATPTPTPTALPQRRPVAVDLPSLTGQISEVLAELRHEYGMAYRTRTWIEDMLPAFGAELDDPVLARSLLAVAALDAGGIRADVTGLSAVHSSDEIIATGTVVLHALQQVREACDGSGDRLAAVVRPSDPSRWPVLAS